MEDRPRFQTGPREIRPSGIIGGPRETWPGWNCAPTSRTERARMVTLHLYTGAPELYPNNPSPNAATAPLRLEASRWYVMVCTSLTALGGNRNLTPLPSNRRGLHAEGRCVSDCPRIGSSPGCADTAGIRR